MEKNDLRDNNDYLYEIDTILTCFKLVYVEEITKNKSYDTFKMLGGDELFDKFAMRASAHVLTATNIEMLNRLQSLVNKIDGGEIKLDNKIRTELRHLGWLEEFEIIPSDTLVDTIFKNASPELYERKLRDTFTASYTQVDQKKTMVKCRNIIKMSKDI